MKTKFVQKLVDSLLLQRHCKGKQEVKNSFSMIANYIQNPPSHISCSFSLKFRFTKTTNQRILYFNRKRESKTCYADFL